MEKNLAAQLMADFLALAGPLNSATVLTSQITDKNEQVTFRAGIGQIMGIVYTELMMPIIQQYPDLDPDRGQPRS